MDKLLVTSCYRGRDKLQADGPLGSYVEVTFTFTSTVFQSRQDLFFSLSLFLSYIYITVPDINFKCICPCYLLLKLFELSNLSVRISGL